MPLDVLGRTRATLMHPPRILIRQVWVTVNMHRDGDRLLKFLVLNEEFLVKVSHQLALITSLPFVHTARRSYRLNDQVRCQDLAVPWIPWALAAESHQTLSFRGRRSRNKVFVGEPAKGSLSHSSCLKLCLHSSV